MDCFVGVMSGTSMDAVDAVVFDVRNRALLATHSEKIPSELRQQTLRITQGVPITIDQVGELDFQWGTLFSQTIRHLTASFDARSIKAIGLHGQTVAHRPASKYPFTLQWGSPHLVAKQIGIPVVASFRQKDLMRGGQGAPLAPLFHREFAPSGTDAVVNLGGIANITRLQPTWSGYDVGPANALMDQWALLHIKTAFDNNGAWAKTGTVQDALLEQWLDDPYFQKLPPKSTGRGYFSLAWMGERCAQYCPEDVQATLVALTAETLYRELQGCRSVFFCGGGVRNAFLMENIEKRLNISCPTTHSFGINPQWMEAIGFAWLAYAYLEGRSFDLAPVTGGEVTSLGVLYE